MTRRLLVLLALCAGCGPDPHPPPPQCTSNAGCAATEVCFDGRCVDALSVSYRLALSIDVAPTEPDGTAWDSDGSPPDVKAQLESGGEPVTNFETQETFHAGWSPRLLGFQAGQSLALHVDDDDPVGSDFICGIQLPELVAFLHQGGLQADGTSCHAVLSATPIDPRGP